MNKELIEKIKKQYWDVGVNPNVPIIEASSPVTGAVMASILAHTKELVITDRHIKEAEDAAQRICFVKVPWQWVEKYKGALTAKYKKYYPHEVIFSGKSVVRYEQMAGATSLSQPGGAAI